MNYLNKVDISGFWGDKKITIKFNSDINFLIGVNGSGKTTLINLIAAVLSADLPTLDRLPFNKIKLQLNEVNGKNKPTIEVEKKTHENSPYPSINFKIKEKTSDKASVYSLNELEEDRYYRGRPIESSRRFRHSRIRRGHGNNLIERLRCLVQASWLSIHRTTAPSRVHEERSYESTIDQKLSELSNEFVRYFSSLEKQSINETEKFQQTIFLSLLSDKSEQKIVKSIVNLNIKNEKKYIIDIFKLFGLDENVFTERVNTHFKTFAEAQQKLDKNQISTLDDLAAIIGTWRIHSVVQEYNKLLDKRKKIFEPRDTFLEVINGLMQSKKLLITDKNELLVQTQSGKMILLTRLSSGEKQLIIILGECLLQEKKPWVYIADEPELSLHIKWQETLVHNLRRINPSSQIIFATHSPDIVSNHGNRIFNVEKFFK